MLNGKLTSIRPLEVNDIDKLYEWYNDEEFSYWISGNWPFVTLLRHEEVERKFYEEDEHRYAITDKEENLIGTIGFDQFNIPARSARIFIGIGAKDYWGKGYGTDALRIFVGYLIKQWNLNRLTAETWDGNTRALSSYQHLGFKVEGSLREAYYIDGKYHDAVILGLLQRDFTS